MSQSEKKPRIAYLTGEYPAVSHTFILREVEALRALGFDLRTCSIRRTNASTHHRGAAERTAGETTFYVLAAAQNPWKFLRAQVEALSRPGRWFSAVRLAWRTRPPGLKALLYQFFYLAEAAVLARQLRQENVDHLHNHFADSSCSVAMLTNELSGIPFSFTMHGPLVFFAAERWRLDEKIARAAFVACISHFCRSQGMLFSHPDHWQKLRIVHCGVDPGMYAKADGRAPGKNILFVGRLAAMKGVPVLLEAFASVLERHPDATLTLIGDGPERDTIEARAVTLGITGAAQFSGYQNQVEVARALAVADIFALPSFAEGVPVVLMEAMATGLPVVATRIAGIPELVDDGQSGLIVPPGDAGAFAEALNALLDDAARRARMGEAGRNRVSAHFESSREAEKLADLFLNAAG